MRARCPPGTVGCIQATETIKAILGKGDLLSGQMIFYDALGMDFEKVSIGQKQDCPVCGDDPVIDSVQDVEYVGACRLETADSHPIEASD